MKNSQNQAVPQASSTSALLQRAIELHHQGDIRQAGLLYLDILEMERDNFDTLQLLGVYALQTNDDQAAFDLISRALEIDPQQAMAHPNLGLALQRLQRFDDALLAYDLALQEETLAGIDRALEIDADPLTARRHREDALRGLKEAAQA